MGTDKFAALDLSSKTGWSIFDENELKDYGRLDCKIVDFNVNKEPNKSPHYPYNIMDASKDMVDKVMVILNTYKVGHVVVENTVKGRNRNTQRFLEWLHYATCEKFREKGIVFKYMDPSEWRAALNIRLSSDDKKNNKKVKKAFDMGLSKKEAKVKGKVGRKHLSVRYVNEYMKKIGIFNYGPLKLKDNDIADSICLGLAYLSTKQKQ